MKRSIAAIIATALITLCPAIASAQTGQDEGEVAEVIVKINTPQGPKWYRLGKDVQAVDVTEGKVVRFNYLDDTIEAIEVSPEGEPVTSDK